jgi:uncharacterized membrane protein YdjX (TVP38/TMEM64 family)
MEEETRPVSWWRGKYSRILVLILAIGMIVTFVLVGIAYKDRIEEIKELENFGYLFIFLMGIAGSASPVWPLPGSWAAFLWAGWAGFGWGVLLVALAAGAGEAIGELSFYMVGYGSQPATSKWKRFQWLEGWINRHGTIAIFLVAAVPNIGVIKFINASAGASHFPVRKMFLLCLAGKTIKSFGFAMAGIGLLSWVTDLL